MDEYSIPPETQKLLDELDEFDRESDAELARIEDTDKYISGLLEPHLLLLEEFNENMDFLENIAMCCVDFDNPKFNFFKGTIWVGVTCAYEGLIHDLSCSLLQDRKFLEEAQKRYTQLDDKWKNKLGIKSKIKPTKEKLEQGLDKMTLNNPFLAGNLLSQLFGFPDMKIEESVWNGYVEIRNNYTHKNGKKDGEQIHITKEMFDDFFIRISDIPKFALAIRELGNRLYGLNSLQVEKQAQ